MINHTFSVEPRGVPGFFTCVNVYPPFLVVAVHFRPYVILAIPDPSNSSSRCSAQHGEAIGPLATPPSLGFQESPHLGISREPFVCTTPIVATLIELDSCSTACCFVRRGWRHAMCYCRRTTNWAKGVIDELEKGPAEPSGLGSARTAGQNVEDTYRKRARMTQS